MKISVLIPTYNRPQYIADAIDSALAQDINDIEIIVVDDGSTDNTSVVLEPYQDRVRYVRTPHQGLAGARNACLQAARGQYLALLDDDDLYYPYKLRLQAQLLDFRPDIGMVYTNFSAFDADGFWDEFHLATYHSSAYRPGGVNYDSLFGECSALGHFWPTELSSTDPLQKWQHHKVYIGHIFEAYLFNTIVFTNSMLFRRELLQTTGWQHSRYGLFHDLEFALRLCKHAKVAFVDVPTYKLRYHPHQVSTTRRRHGELIAIRKQRDLLRVTRDHALRDTNYYRANRTRVDQQLARLCRAVAVPLLAHASGSRQTDRYFARRARLYLAKCREYGRAELLLCAMSYAPHLVRRVVFRLQSIIGAWKADRRRTAAP